MSKIVHRLISSVLMTVVLFLVTDAGASETSKSARQGFYLGADIGVSVPDDLESTRTNNGISTNCDQWLGGDTLGDGTTVPLPLAECSPRALPGRPNSFDLGTVFWPGSISAMPRTTFVLKPSTFGANKAVNVQHSTFPGTPNKLSLSNEVKKSVISAPITSSQTSTMISTICYRTG